MQLYSTYKERSSKSKRVINAPNQEVPQHIRDELLARVKTFFGNDGLEKIRNSFVVVSFDFFFYYYAILLNRLA